MSTLLLLGNMAHGAILPSLQRMRDWGRQVLVRLVAQRTHRIGTVDVRSRQRADTFVIVAGQTRSLVGQRMRRRWNRGRLVVTDDAHDVGATNMRSRQCGNPLVAMAGTAWFVTLERMCDGRYRDVRGLMAGKTRTVGPFAVVRRQWRNLAIAMTTGARIFAAARIMRHRRDRRLRRILRMAQGTHLVRAIRMVRGQSDHPFGTVALGARIVSRRRVCNDRHGHRGGVTNDALLVRAIRVIGGQRDQAGRSVTRRAGGFVVKIMRNRRDVRDHSRMARTTGGRGAAGMIGRQRGELTGGVTGRAVLVALENMPDIRRLGRRGDMAGLAGLVIVRIVRRRHREQGGMTPETVVATFECVWHLWTDDHRERGSGRWWVLCRRGTGDRRRRKRSWRRRRNLAGGDKRE